MRESLSIYIILCGTLNIIAQYSRGFESNTSSTRRTIQTMRLLKTASVVVALNTRGKKTNNCIIRKRGGGASEGAWSC